MVSCLHEELRRLLHYRCRVLRMNYEFLALTIFSYCSWRTLEQQPVEARHSTETKQHLLWRRWSPNQQPGSLSQFHWRSQQSKHPTTPTVKTNRPYKLSRVRLHLFFLRYFFLTVGPSPKGSTTLLCSGFHAVQSPPRPTLPPRGLHIHLSTLPFQHHAHTEDGKCVVSRNTGTASIFHLLNIRAHHCMLIEHLLLYVWDV